MSAVDLGQEIENLLRPLRELHEVAAREEKKAYVAYDETRTRRKEIERMLRAVDPSFAAKNGAGPGRPKKNSAGFSEQALTSLGEWLQANAEKLNEGVGFNATELAQAEAGNPAIPTQSGLSKALRMLHERGVVRLDSVGGGQGAGKGSSGRKNYKVVT